MTFSALFAFNIQLTRIVYAVIVITRAQSIDSPDIEFDSVDSVVDGAVSFDLTTVCELPGDVFGSEFGAGVADGAEVDTFIADGAEVDAFVADVVSVGADVVWS